MTSQSHVATNPEIARRAQELKTMYLGLMLMLPLMFDPQLPALQWALRHGSGSEEDVEVRLGHGPEDQEKLIYSARAILTAATQLHGAVMAEDLLSVSMLVGGTRLCRGGGSQF